MRIAIVALIVAAWLAHSTALANGRAPATVAVTTRPGHVDEIYLAATFGLLVSRDGGCSFRWICEQSIGYGGTFDPTYAVAPDGTIFATTFEGLSVSRDGGCSFEKPAAVAGLWVDAIDVAVDGTVWIGTAESGGTNNIYKSTDGGRSFVAQGLASQTRWYKSVKSAPSDASQLYVTGYQVADAPQAYLFRSLDGGHAWLPQALVDVDVGLTPNIVIEAVDPTTSSHVLLRSVGARNNGDVLYESLDAGASWQEAFAATGSINDVQFVGDEVWLGTSDGLFRRMFGGSFEAVPDAPAGRCVTPAGGGDVFSCGTNWAPDFQALGRLHDGTWNSVFRFSSLAGPVMCPAGTPTHDVCEQDVWPTLQQQLGTTPPACLGTVDAASPADGAPHPPSGGCCNGGGEPFAGMWVVAMYVGRMRRRKRLLPNAISKGAQSSTRR